MCNHYFLIGFKKGDKKEIIGYVVETDLENAINYFNSLKVKNIYTHQVIVQSLIWI